MILPGRTFGIIRERMDASIEPTSTASVPPWLRAVKRPSLALFALIAMALIGAMWLILNTIQAERSERVQVRRTNQVLQSLRDINRAAVDAETGQRGFYITLDRRYLAPYLFARERYRPAVAELTAAMGASATPRQKALLMQVGQLSDAKFAELGQTIAQIEAGDVTGAQRRILSDEGQDVMERLRRSILELEATESGILDRANAAGAANEARVIPLLMMLLGLVGLALGLGLWLVVRTANAEAAAANAAALGEARDRADLLARELNHRVKNLFAVVLAIVRMSGRDAPEARPVIERIAARIHALLKAHEVTTGAPDKAVAQLGLLIDTAVAPYRSEANVFQSDGPEIVLTSRDVVPLGLVLHELVTNTVKYGAWAAPGGKLRVAWTLDDAVPQNLSLVWRETCGGPCPGSDHTGFGTLLIQSSARQLGGTARRVFHSDGIELQIDFPLRA